MNWNVTGKYSNKCEENQWRDKKELPRIGKFPNNLKNS
jgi:hypothetical protein